jgi:hypothetical protein
MSIFAPMTTTPTGMIVSPMSVDSEDHSHHHFTSMRNLQKTSFPLQGVPELDLTDESSNSSDEENSVQREKYSSKVDQDVQVFMVIAERLSVTSLVHLLQGHVRTQQDHQWHYHTLNALREEAERQQMVLPEQPKPLKVRKAFRFATVRDGDVRAVVHEVEDLKQMKELWWNEKEMMDFRCNAVETVKHYRKYRKKYIDAIETIASTAKLDSDSAVNTKQLNIHLEDAVKLLTVDSYARGLETHICSFLSKARRETVESVLEEQLECRKCSDSYALTAEALRGQSLAYSVTSLRLAVAMGNADHIEALKAVMSAWVPEEFY